MSTEFYNRNWRMPNSFNGSTDNNSKVSNYSMTFDGSSEYIDCGTISSIPSATELSVSFWANTDSTSQNQVVFGDNSSTPIFSFEYWGSLNRMYFEYGTGTFAYLTLTDVVNAGSWHNVVLVYNGSAASNTDKVKIYVDGVDKSSLLTYTGTIPDSLSASIGDFWIGNGQNYNQPFNGKIDHVAIFDYALTQPQITALYGSSSTGVGNPMAITNGRKPVAYYPIGDYSAFNGEYLVPNSAVSDYVFKSDSSSGPVINLPLINLGTTNTVSFWYHNDIQDSVQIAIGSSTNQFDYLVFISTGFSIALNSTTYSIGNPQVALKFDNTDAANIFMKANTWIHIAFIRNGDSVSLYLNGSFNETLTGVGTTNDTILDTLISESDGFGSHSINGKMSNVSVFNTALPATGTESVESLYNYGTPPDISSYSGLQGWWKLDASATFDGSNWSIPDDSSNSNTGTSSGMTAANLVQASPPLLVNEPYSRYALDFDGTGDFINCGVDSVFDFGTSDFAWSFWLNYESHTNYAGIFFTGVSSSTYRLKFQTSGQILFMQNADGDSQVADLGTDITGTGWHHIVLSRSSGTITTFLDGSQVDTDSRAGNINQGGSSFFIGRNGTSYLNGQLSNISIWNTALNQTQVTELYNSGKPSNLNSFSAYSNLISWWQLGENMSYNSNVWTVLNEISTAPNGVGSSNAPAEIAIVNGVGTSGNGISSGMGGGNNIVGEAPQNSTANAISYGMGVDARVSGSGNVPS